jgi:hypothetical protein
VPSKAERAQQRRFEKQHQEAIAAHRAYIDSLPAPDSLGHVIPQVYQLVEEIHNESGMRFQANSRHVRAVIGIKSFLHLYARPAADA